MKRNIKDIAKDFVDTHMNRVLDNEKLVDLNRTYPTTDDKRRAGMLKDYASISTEFQIKTLKLSDLYQEAKDNPDFTNFAKAVLEFGGPNFGTQAKEYIEKTFSEKKPEMEVLKPKVIEVKNGFWGRVFGR